MTPWWCSASSTTQTEIKLLTPPRGSPRASKERPMDQDRPGAGSFKPLMTSAERLPASMDLEAAEAASYAAERARLLLGCYRTGDANDPETYVAAITAILSRSTRRG
jgi:hypothetical protein